MNRQEGIEKNLIELASNIAGLMTPGIPVSDKAKTIAKMNAAATAKTYDSGSPIPMLASTSKTFNHNMGYIPIITIINQTPGDHLIYITDLTEIDCTIFHFTGSSNPAMVKIFAH